MVKLYFAKLNINSNINKINEKKIKIILNGLFEVLDDQKDFAKVIPKKYTDENGDEKLTYTEEYYNFSQIEKNSEESIITGFLVRRMKTYIERFDKSTRTSLPETIEDTSIGTMFFFDVNKEIITFTTRNRFRQLQIIEAFEGLINKYLENITVKVMLINNPFEIDDALKRMKVVHKITTTFIPPNAANKLAIEKIIGQKKKEYKQVNATVEEYSLISDDNEKGLNKRSKKFRDLIEITKAFAKNGYGKLLLEGQNQLGEEIVFNSNDKAPYTENISDENKDDRSTIYDISKEAIKRLKTKITLTNRQVKKK